MSHQKSKNNQKKNMLIVCNSLSYFNDHKTDLFKGLEDNWNLNLFTGEANIKTDAINTPNTISLTHIPIQRFTNISFVDLAALKILLKHIKNTNPNLIVSFTLKANLITLLAVWLSKNKKESPPKVVIVFPGLGRVFDKNSNGFFNCLRRRLAIILFKFLFSKTNADAVFENSDNRNYWIDTKIASPKKTWRKKGTGVPIPIKLPVKPKNGPLQVIYASRLLKAKGVQVFINAAKRLEGNANISFVLYGGASEEEKDGVKIVKTDTPSNLIFMGEQPLEEILEKLKTAHCVCLPTRYLEGVPRILLEGAANKCVLIASDVSGCRDLIETEKNGFLLDATSTQTLTEGLVETLTMLSNDRELTIAMGQKSQDLILINGYEMNSVREVFQKEILQATSN